MKILLVSDEETVRLAEGWSRSDGGRYADIDLILSAGDLAPSYLEYLVTMFNVPCLYVRGNHDERYDETPPGGCICIEDRICEVSVPVKAYNAATHYTDGVDICSSELSSMRVIDDSICGNSVVNESANDFHRNTDIESKSESDSETEIESIRIAGLGGSIRYRPGGCMYTEREMRSRAFRLYHRARAGMMMLTDERKRISRREPPVDILLTHAPCRGHGDLDDYAHRGFECFNWLHDKLHPAYHCYGHVHYNYGMIKRKTTHPSGATLINVSGMYILEI